MQTAKKKPKREEMGHTEKDKFFFEFVLNAPGRKLIHVKELKDVGEWNIQLEQTNLSSVLRDCDG